MSIKVDVNYKPYTQDVTVCTNIQSQIELILKSVSDESSVMVKDFPSFLKASLASNLALLRAQVAFNMVSQRLVRDADPLLVTDMDSMTLGELDIGQDEMFYSI